MGLQKYRKVGVISISLIHRMSCILCILPPGGCRFHVICYFLDHYLCLPLCKWIILLLILKLCECLRFFMPCDLILF